MTRPELVDQAVLCWRWERVTGALVVVQVALVVLLWVNLICWRPAVFWPVLIATAVTKQVFSYAHRRWDEALAALEVALQDRP